MRAFSTRHSWNVSTPIGCASRRLLDASHPGRPPEPRRPDYGARPGRSTVSVERLLTLLTFGDHQTEHESRALGLRHEHRDDPRDQQAKLLEPAHRRAQA